MDVTLTNVLNNSLSHLSTDPIVYFAVIIGFAITLLFVLPVVRWIIGLFSSLIGIDQSLIPRDSGIKYNLQGKDDFSTWYTKVYPAKSQYPGYDYKKGYDNYLQT